MSFLAFFITVSISAQVRVTAIEGFRFFMTPQDEEAMNWIKENTPKDAIFAIDTYLWLGYSLMASMRGTGSHITQVEEQQQVQ